MGKSKYNDAAGAKAAIETKKEELAVAEKEKRAFEKDNGLKKGEDHSEHPKHGKKWAKMDKNIQQLEADIEEAKNWLKENKPKKEKKERQLKYDYPADCTTDEQKKKFRATMRAEAKKAEKGEKKSKASKEEKASKGEGEGKKKKKNKKPQSSED